MRAAPHRQGAVAGLARTSQRVTAALAIELVDLNRAETPDRNQARLRRDALQSLLGHPVLEHRHEADPELAELVENGVTGKAAFEAPLHRAVA